MRFFFIFSLFFSPILALPPKPIILKGTASVEVENCSMTVHAKEDCLLEWESFDLQENESIFFEGPVSINNFVQQMPLVCSGTIKSDGELSFFSSSFYQNATSEIRGSEIHIFAEDKLEIFGSIKVESDSVGGNLTLLGKEISLRKAVIELSGENQGGNLTIGKPLENYPASSSVIIDKDSMIFAQAKMDGKGGTVDVWSDDFTLFEGFIDVQGGIIRGDGGYVDISSEKNLTFVGTVDRRASYGKNGLLVLDPEADIFIQSNGNATGTFSGSSPFTYDPSSPTNILSIGPGSGTLLEQLSLGDVLVQTNYGGSVGPQGGRITVVDDILYSEYNNLTLQANGENVVINARVENQSTGNIEINAPNGDVLIQPTAGNNATLLSGGDIIIQSVGGNVTLQSGTGLDESAALGNHSPFPTTGNVLMSISGNLLLIGGNNPGNTSRILAQNGTITINVDGNIDLSGGTTSHTDVQIASNPGNSVTISSGGDITLQGSSFASDAMFIGNASNDPVSINCTNLQMVANIGNNSAIIGTEGSLDITIAGDLHMQSGSLGAEAALIGKTSASLNLSPGSRIFIQNGTLESPDFAINP